MRRRLFYFIFACVGLAAPLGAQTPSITGPVLGAIYNSASRLVRPVAGIAGSSHLGPPVIQEADAAFIGPDGSWAFVARSGKYALMSGLSTSSPSEIPVSGLIDNIDRVTWSRDGSHALLYASSHGLLQRVALTASPSADAPLEVSPFGTISSFALDPTGRQIAFGVSQRGLYLFSAGQSPALISSSLQPAALAFDGPGARLFVADVTTGQVVEFDSGVGPQPFAPITQPDGSLLRPIGMTLSAGDKYLLLPVRENQSVLVFDVASRSLADTLSLDFPPTRFEPLSSDPAFVLNSGGRHEWLMVLDGRETPKIYIVPAGEEFGR